MKRHSLNFVILFLCLALVFPAKAESSFSGDENSVISVLATACESLQKGEMRSSARIKAADKASFKAVERISDLAKYRQAFAGHDYNVLVYNIIDNYLEDLTVKTIEQDDEKLCVEISGFISPQNIQKAFDESFNKFSSAVSNQMEEKIVYLDEDENSLSQEPELFLEEEPQALVQTVSGLPPKPNPTFNQEMLQDTAEVSDAVADNENSQEPINIVLNNTDNNPSVAEVHYEEDRADDGQHDSNKISVYIKDTEFYNNTTTSDYYDLLQRILTSRPDIRISPEEDKADYVLTTKVLKAKVDPINSQTNRLHLVLAIELQDKIANDLITEHQNRFVLFESNENEQTVAADLMEKLIQAAGKQIVKVPVKHKRASYQENNSVITPVHSNFRRS